MGIMNILFILALIFNSVQAYVPSFKIRKHGILYRYIGKRFKVSKYGSLHWSTYKHRRASWTWSFPYGTVILKKQSLMKHGRRSFALIRCVRVYKNLLGVTRTITIGFIHRGSVSSRCPF